MSDAPTVAKQLAAALVAGFSATSAPAGGATAPATPGPTMLPNLVTLIDALPYYSSAEYLHAHRSALATAFANSIANSPVEPQPSEISFVSTSYSYSGGYSGYRDAFYNGSPPTETSNAVLKAIPNLGASPLSIPWATVFGVALTTDAIRTRVAVALDTSSLATVLTQLDQTIRPALTATCLATLIHGYRPTAQALAALSAAGENPTAATQLTQAVQAPAFIANVNHAIGMGGESTSAATWFLWNNWQLLMALGATDIDGIIKQAQADGLQVPTQVGPDAWWWNGYNAWFSALNGDDAAALAGANLTATMPESEMMSGPNGWPYQTDTSLANGYALSFCQWGAEAAFKPPDSSCLGRGTGVLMADGSVRPIEEIAVGDLVMSVGGPRAVVLVESPLRSGRTLTQVNDLAVWATDGHPFLAADGPMRRSVDPWTLIDAAPTMTGEGVGTLTVGSQIVGRDTSSGAQTDVEIEVTALTPTSASEGDTCEGDATVSEERVYDLLLKDWERGHATYFVGGPDLFVAVDAEAPDPLQEPHATSAVIVAMDAALDAARANVTRPSEELAVHVNRLNPTAWHHKSRVAAAIGAEGKIKRPPVPGPDYFMLDGEWEPHASALEVGLIRRFGRAWRRAASTGWHQADALATPEAHLTVLVHDAELVGDLAIADGDVIDVRIEALAASLPDALIGAVTPQTTSRWRPRFDQLVDFGPLEAVRAIRATVSVGDTTCGSAWISSDAAAAHPDRASATEHLLFDGSGAVAGRLAVTVGWQAPADIPMLRDRAALWSRKAGLMTAVSLGQQAGRELADALDPTVIWLPASVPASEESMSG